VVAAAAAVLAVVLGAGAGGSAAIVVVDLLLRACVWVIRLERASVYPVYVAEHDPSPHSQIRLICPLTLLPGSEGEVSGDAVFFLLDLDLTDSIVLCARFQQLSRSRALCFWSLLLAGCRWRMRKSDGRLSEIGVHECW
jgi:hypothetical protein